MAKRTVKKTAPVSAGRVREGWHGPAGTRIRLARPGEVKAVDALLEAAGVQVIPELGQAIEDGSAGSVLLSGLETRGTFHREAAMAIATGSMATALSVVSLTLVAAADDGALVGALSVTPPGTILQRMLDEGRSPASALTLGVAIGKVHGLAVADTHRGQGLGAALLKRAWQVYDLLGFFVLYGSFETDRDLAGFYTGCGYSVLEAGEGFTLAPLGEAVGIHSGPHERVFVRWRPHR